MTDRRLLPLLLIALRLGGCAPAGRGPEPGEPAHRREPVAMGELRTVVEEALPAIVFIEVEAAPPEILQRLHPGLELPGEPVPIGVGSGVLFREDGHILTNNHVVRQAELARHEPGATSELLVVRDGGQARVRVQLDGVVAGGR